jgi:hypothetical protein
VTTSTQQGFLIEWKLIAYDLRMTPTLLKWFTSYAVRKSDMDKQKLSTSQDQAPSQQAAKQFNEWLWQPWPKKNVPLGSWCFSGHLRIDRGARS